MDLFFIKKTLLAAFAISMGASYAMASQDSHNPYEGQYEVITTTNKEAKKWREGELIVKLNSNQANAASLTCIKGKVKAASNATDLNALL